jgi:putative ABC transport system substrate-binding protein
MRRIGLAVVLAISLFVAPLAVVAQQSGKVSRIATIASGAPSAPVGQGPFYDRLRELGWIQGRDVIAERRAYGDQIQRVPELAAELMRTGVDVFVVEGATEAEYVQQLTRDIPIVTSRAGDLVVAGLAASLARPGGNVTGIQTLQPDLIPKQLSLLKEAFPRLTRAGILLQQSSAAPGPIFRAVRLEAEAGAKALGITLQSLTIHGGDELQSAFAAFKAARAEAVVVVRSQYLSTYMNTVTDLALKHGLPTVSDTDPFASRGGLMSYGYDFRETQRAAAGIVDKILRGAKASDIPIQQATVLQLVVNLKTAQALGLTMPPSILVRADQVIE